MRLQHVLSLSLAFALALVGCKDQGADRVMGPEAGDLEVQASHQGQGAVVASARGGGNWTLNIDGFPPIEQVLGFNAKKFSDGSVQGRIRYHQAFGDQSFRWSARVTCMSVYDGGTRVKYGGEITKSNDPAFPEGVFIWFQGIDNGEGAGAPADQSTGSGFGNEAENQAFCDSPEEPNPIFLAPINGNIQVSG